MRKQQQNAVISVTCLNDLVKMLGDTSVKSRKRLLDV